MPPSSFRVRLPAVLLLLLFCTRAFAHHLPPGMEEVDEFADSAAFLAGFNHSLTGLDHMAAALAAGWFAAGMAAARRIVFFGTVMTALLAGAAIGRAGVALPAMEPVLLASLVLSAVLAASRGALWPVLAAVVMPLFQMWHGNLHATAAAGAQGMSVSFLTGTIAATLVLAAGGLTGALLTARWRVAEIPGIQPAC